MKPLMPTLALMLAVACAPGSSDDHGFDDAEMEQLEEAAGMDDGMQDGMDEMDDGMGDDMTDGMSQDSIDDMGDDLDDGMSQDSIDQGMGDDMDDGSAM